jgi:hypothetical protein
MTSNSVDGWDDSAILAIYSMSIESHNIKGNTGSGNTTRPKVKGEYEVGGMSRKAKKRALKLAIAKAKETGEPLDKSILNLFEPHQSLNEKQGVNTDLNVLDIKDRAFVERFMAYTEEPCSHDNQTMYPPYYNYYHYYNYQSYFQHYDQPEQLSDTQKNSAELRPDEGRSDEGRSYGEIVAAWEDVCAARYYYDCAAAKYIALISATPTQTC